jgi:hypothetical protein
VAATGVSERKPVSTPMRKTRKKVMEGLRDR